MCYICISFRHLREYNVKYMLAFFTVGLSEKGFLGSQKKPIQLLQPKVVVISLYK